MRQQTTVANEKSCICNTALRCVDFKCMGRDYPLHSNDVTAKTDTRKPTYADQ